MNRTVIWAPSAVRDLKEIFEYIKMDSAERATKWVETVLSQAEQLAQFPQMGRPISELKHPRYRELILGNHRLFHEVKKKEILIFRVLHSRRLYPE